MISSAFRVRTSFAPLRGRGRSAEAARRTAAVCRARRADEVEGKAAQHERSIFEAKGQDVIDREKQRQKIKKKRKVGKAHGETPVIICQRLIVHAGAERGNGKIRNSSRNRRVSQNMRFWFTCGGKRATILRRRLRKTQRLIFYVNRKR